MLADLGVETAVGERAAEVEIALERGRRRNIFGIAPSFAFTASKSCLVFPVACAGSS